MPQLSMPDDRAGERSGGRFTWGGHLQIMRVDHWVKNVFVLPGIVLALTVDVPDDLGRLVVKVLVGLLATSVIASSNYVINEVLDAPLDRFHPTKRERPVPSGRVNVQLAYVQWIALMVVGLGLASLVSQALAVTLAVLWLMGCLYNIRPVRTKDLPYVDVVSEAVNNPLRMLAGWYMVGPDAIVPASLLASYWMVGCYFMAIKRFAEYRDIGDAEVAGRYRKSFRHYTESRLLVSIMFYGSAAMLFFGAFLMRYRLEMILTYPLVAFVMAAYLAIGLKPNSAAQAPERLYREPTLMISTIAAAIAILVLLVVDIPVLQKVFAPLMPTALTSARSDGAASGDATGEPRTSSAPTGGGPARERDPVGTEP